MASGIGGFNIRSIGKGVDKFLGTSRGLSDMRRAEGLLKGGEEEYRLGGQAETDRLLGSKAGLTTEQGVAAQGSAAPTLAQLGILSPWMNQGFAGFGQQLFGTNVMQNAAGGIQNIATNPSAIYQDPGYQASLSQGVSAAEMGASARGTQLSGGQMAGLSQLGMTMANQYRAQRVGELTQQAVIGGQLQAGGLSLASLGANVATRRAELGSEAEKSFGLQNLSNRQQMELANLQARQDSQRLGLDYDTLISGQRMGTLEGLANIRGSRASLASGIGKHRSEGQKFEQQRADSNIKDMMSMFTGMGGM